MAKTDSISVNAASTGKNVKNIEKISPIERAELDAMKKELEEIRESLVIQEEKEPEKFDQVQVLDPTKEAKTAGAVRGTVNFGGGFVRN